MKAILAIALCAATLSAAPHSSAQDSRTTTAPVVEQPEATTKDLATALEAIRTQHAVPALGGLILIDGAVHDLAAVGIRRSDLKESAVDIDDSWHLGSCTKAMTATLCGRLVEAGRLRWDQNLTGMFDGIDVHASLEEATLAQLLSHRAGLMANPVVGELWADLFAFEGPIRSARNMVAAKILPAPATHSPGSDFVYSNTGYMIAGAALERRLDKSWEDALRADVFEPLKMNSAGFGPPGADGKDETPIWGHSDEGEPCRPSDRSSDNPPALGPAGTVHASLRDWAKFVDLYARHVKAEPRLLKPETIHRITTPAKGQDYAFGWMQMRRGWASGPVLFHNGSNTMWMCAVWVSPDDGFAVMATCNQGGDAATLACNAACETMLKNIPKTQRR